MKHFFDLMEKILGAENGEVTLEIPEGNFNLLMLQALRDKGRRENKTVRFISTGPRSKRLIGSLEKGAGLPEIEREEKEAAKVPRSRGLVRKLVVPFAFLIGILIVLGAAAFGALYYLPKAEIILTLSPIPLVKEITVTVDTAATEMDAATGTVPGTSQVVEENGTKSTPATGTAIVGEKAKGTIAFTSTLNQHCSAGARLKEDSSSLVFTLDAATDFAILVPQDKAVTAEKIGTAYNITSGKTFHFLSGCDSIGSIAGQNSDAFTGGTSEEVTIATVADQSKLLTDLQKELVSKAKETIQSQSGIDEVLIDKVIKTTIVEKTYSHAVGEQAEQVTLTLKIKLTTITYKGTDIQNLISQSLSSLIPSGYTLFPGEVEIEPLDPVLKGSKLTFKAKVSAQVIQEIDEEKIKNDLAGRNARSAQDYLNSLSDVNAYELVLWPNLPESLQRIPKTIKRITITLVTEE